MAYFFKESFAFKWQSLEVAAIAKHAIINSELCATISFFQYKYLFIFIIPKNITAHCFNSQVQNNL